MLTRGKKKKKTEREAYLVEQVDSTARKLYKSAYWSQTGGAKSARSDRIINKRVTILRVGTICRNHQVALDTRDKSGLPCSVPHWAQRQVRRVYSSGAAKREGACSPSPPSPAPRANRRWGLREKFAGPGFSKLSHLNRAQPSSHFRIVGSLALAWEILPHPLSRPVPM